MRGRGFFEPGILRVLANVTFILSGTAEGQTSAAAVGAVGRSRHRGKFVSAVGQREAERKRAVGAELDHAVSDFYFGIRFGGAVNDEFGVDVEPKTFATFPTTERAGKAGDGATPGTGNGELRNRSRRAV